MSWETALMIGMNAFKAASTMSAAKKEAKAKIAEGNIVASNKALETKRKAAAAKVSFLNSGLTLEGTPENAIQGIFDTGLQDINQINQNYNNSAKATISSARTQAISTIFEGFSGMSFGGDLQFGGSGFNGVGQSIGSIQSPSPVGPYQPFGGF